MAIVVETPIGGLAFTGNVFIDGSGTHPTCRLRNRVGFGAYRADENGNDLGSIFGPAPLLLQEVPGAEAYALLAVIEMGLPPMRVYSDCMYVVSTFRDGEDRAMLASKPFADLWGRIFLSLIHL